MNINELINIVNKINTFITQGLWLDFEVNQYKNSKLKIIGGIDLLYSPDIEINFEDVFFVSLPFAWKSDTKKEVFQLLEDENARTVNIMYKVEQGYHIFKFTPEDYPADFGCLIGAKSISYNILSNN